MRQNKFFLVLIFLSIATAAIHSEETSILPQSYLRSWDPITVFFDRDTGPAEGGNLDIPGEIIKITPDHPGEYRWIDSRTLQFNPTIPWPPLKRFKISSGGAVQNLSTMMLAPKRVSPNNNKKNLDPFDTVALTFSEPVDVKTLKDIITFEIRPLPGVGTDNLSYLTSKDFEVRRVEKTSRDFKYQVKLNNKIPYGKSVTIKLSLSIDSSIDGAIGSYTFSTKDEFRITGMGSGSVKYPVSNSGSVYGLSQAINCGTGSNPLFIEFSERPKYISVSELKKLVSFEPSVSNLTYSQSGRKIYLRFNVEKETPYKISINSYQIKSSSDRDLAPIGKTHMYFYYNNLSPYLKWNSGQVIAEQFGPQYFPMEGRATDMVDLRVYKIDSLDRKFWPFPSKPVIIDEEYRPLMPGEDEDAKSIRDNIKLLGAPPVSQVVNLPINKSSGKSKFGLNLAPYLSEISGENKPGTYLVGYRILGNSNERNYVRVVVTDLSLTTVEEEQGINFVVTSLNTGKPIKGANIKLEGMIYKKASGKSYWGTILEGKTDKDGQYHYNHKEYIKSRIERVTIVNGEDVLPLDTENPPPVFNGNHWYSSTGSWLGWLNDKPRKEKELPRNRGYIFTERPIYRPDEPVHIMGYVRTREKGIIKSDTSDIEKHINIVGPGYKQWDYPVNLEGNDQFYHKFDEKDLPTGQYTARLVEDETGIILSSVTFKKEAYRVPRFEINLTGEERVPVDKPFTVELVADYYAGGRVVGQRVDWTVTRYPYFASSNSYPGFIFASDERFSGYSSYSSLGSSSYQDKTDENGASKLELDPTTDGDATSVKYVIEATVRGADSQTVSDTKEVIALPPFTLGINIDKFLKETKTISPQVVLLDYNDKPISGREFTMRLYRREWHSYLTETDFTTGQAKYVSDIVDNKIYEKVHKALSDKPTPIEIDVEESGVYVLEVLAYDDLGRMQKVRSDFYISGETPVSWKKTQSNVFETVLDKKKYKPGDEVSMLLKSPFQNAEALVVMETPERNEYFWVQIKNGQGVYTFTVEENMAPGLPVHTLLMRGRLKGSGKNIKGIVDRGKPISMGNTTWIDISPTSNEAVVKLDHKKVNLPGSKMKMDITLTDPYGKPLTGDVALWLVDRAVLALGNERKLDPLNAFIDPVNSYIRIRDIRNKVVGNLPLQEYAGGDGMYDAESEADLMENTTVRKNFRTVAFYESRIPVKNGKASINIDLPDNLTDFAVRAVAVSGFSRFGTAKSTVKVRLPVIVQTALPRFVRPGDRFTAGGIGRIVEGDGGKGRVQIKTDGIILDNNKNSLTEKMTWEKKIPHKLFYPMEVPESLSDRENVTVSMAIERSSDKASDAFEVKLPVSYTKIEGYKDGIYELKPGETIPFPSPKSNIKKGSLKQTVYASPSKALIKMLSGIELLESYPHGCAEQRVSKIYPQIALKNFFKELGIDDIYRVDKSKVDSVLLYLESVQSPEGLFSFWPGSTPYVGLTAYILDFLTTVDKNGFNVDKQLIKRSVSALKKALRSDSDYLVSDYSLRDRVDAFCALANYGYFDKSYASDLLKSSKSSSLYNKAKMVSVYIDNNKGGNREVKELIDQLWEATTFELKGSNEVFAGLQYKQYNWGGLVLSSEVGTLSSVITALYKAEPNNNKIKSMTEFLINQGGDSGWNNTKSTSDALIALSKTLQSLKSNKTIKYIIGAKNSEVSRKLDSSLDIYTLTEDDMGKVSLNNNEPNIYVWLKTKYHIGDNVRAITEESNGFMITSELIEISGRDRYEERHKVTAGKAIVFKKDTVIEQHVNVINSRSGNFIAISIPFAAGFEPLNPELATAPPEAEPKGNLTREPSYSLYLDDKVIFYYDSLPKGTYDFYFRLRASIEGDYFQPPGFAEMMYKMSFNGISNAGAVRIES